MATRLKWMVQGYSGTSANRETVMAGPYLFPPKTCDLCHGPIKDEFSDVKIPGHGSWGNLCPSCVGRNPGVSYGTGRGQRYQKHPADGKFYKVEG